MAENLSQPLVIEKTSKRFKRQYLLGLALMLLGPVLTGVALTLLGLGPSDVLPPEHAGWLVYSWVLAGLAWLVITRVRVWWHHG